MIKQENTIVVTQYESITFVMESLPTGIFNKALPEELAKDTYF